MNGRRQEWKKKHALGVHTEVLLKLPRSEDREDVLQYARPGVSPRAKRLVLARYAFRCRRGSSALWHPRTSFVLVSLNLHGGTPAGDD